MNCWFRLPHSWCSVTLSYQSTTKIFKFYIQTIHSLPMYEILLYTKMYLRGFKTTSMFHSYNNRNKSDLFITSHNNKLFVHSIAYNSVLIYNKLPHEIKVLYCITKFKKILINFLHEKSFYSVEEFMTNDPFVKNCVNDVFYILFVFYIYAAMISILCCFI
jgi:hypothetical protein